MVSPATDSNAMTVSLESTRMQRRSYRPVNERIRLEKMRMLVSHCDEYMANGPTNAVRHEFVMIANDRK